MFKPIVKLFVLMMMGVMVFMPFTQAFAALDNKGTDFIVVFNPNTLGGAQTNQVQLQLTGDVATNVTVNYPVNTPTFTATVAIVPGTVTTVNLPLTVANGGSVGIVQNNAVRAFSTTGDEFVMYLINRRTASSDAALGLPIDTMNTEYFVVTAFSNIVQQDRAQFTVVAGFDNTDVTITPSRALAGGFTAGTPFTISLNRGEGFLGQSTSSGTNGDLTGTLIQSTRPVGMTNGNLCTNVLPTAGACDHVFEVAQPVQSWGQSIPVANLPNRAGGSVYRIIAATDSTSVTQDGVSIGALNRGDFLVTGALTGDHVFAGDKPIYVVQYMTGQTSAGAVSGDPAMGNMIPSAQYLTNYTFATVGDNQFLTHFLTIVANNSDLATILLDGAIIGAGPFSPIAGTSFSVARLPLSEGTHTTSSTNGHGITVEGFNNFDSYIYPGGALFQFINPTGDPFSPVCNAPISGTPPKANGTCTDNTPTEDANGNGVLDAGEDANGNGVIDADTGIFFVELVAGATNLNLVVDPFVPGDPQVTFMVNLVDPNQSGTGTVRVTDGAGNTTDVPINIQVGTPSVDCDVDADGDIDRTDVGLIFAARGQTASGPDDPRDPNGDGIITVQDARICVLRIP